MARVWKQMLKQESEHQWLAISAFFVFVIIGALLIKGTSFLSGVDIIDNEIGEDARILDSQYIDGDESYFLIYQSGEYSFVWNNDGISTPIINSETKYDAGEINSITKLSNDSILLSQDSSELLFVDGGDIYEFETNYGNEIYSIKSIAENRDSEAQEYLMITNENGSYTSIRGLSSNNITSSPTLNNENVEWKNIISTGEQEWFASGTYIPPIASGGDSPASPTIKPVYAKIIWSGGFTAPMISNLHIGAIGEYHSIVNLNHEEILIAGTHETIIMNHITGEIENIDYSSVAAVVEDCEVAWLFNGQDSKSVLRIKNSELEMMKLPHTLPLDVESNGFDGEVIYLHGIDYNGESRVMTFDTTSVGSIESGRGFLNLSFVIISLIVLSVMMINAYDRFRDDKLLI